jgi:hypothetical protein
VKLQWPVIRWPWQHNPGDPGHPEVASPLLQEVDQRQEELEKRLRLKAIEVESDVHRRNPMREGDT